MNIDFLSPGLPPLLAAFVFGLMGGAHCIGMCGGIMSALTLSIPPSMRRPRRVFTLMLGYSVGRIASYMLAGASVALVGKVLNHALDEVALVLRLLAAVLLLLMGLYIANWWRGLVRIEALGRGIWRLIEPFGKRFIPVTNHYRAIALGSIWGWLPCGLVYSMLAWSLAVAEPVNAAALMGAFGLGTLPTVLATGIAARTIVRLVRHKWVQGVAGSAIVMLAGWQVLYLVSMYQVVSAH